MWSRTELCVSWNRKIIPNAYLNMKLLLEMWMDINLRSASSEAIVM